MSSVGGLKSRVTSMGQAASLALLGLMTQASWAVNDLPGGPAVRQLDLPTPVTKIAAEQQWLHNFMLYICSVIFVAG